MNHAPSRFQRCLATINDIGGRLCVTSTVQSGAAIAQGISEQTAKPLQCVFSRKNHSRKAEDKDDEYQ
jgi:hypothetical protein